MSADRDVNRIVRSWLEGGATALPDRVLDNVLDQLPATPQRRTWWPARRFRDMNTFARFAVAAAAVVAIAVVGINLLPRQGVSGPGASPTATPSPTPSPSPVALHDGALAAGSYLVNPSTHPAWTACPQPTTPGCSDPAAAKSIRFRMTVPEGWAGIGPAVWLATEEAAPPGGATVGFGRGSWMHSDPCRDAPEPDFPVVEVGPTVDDFADALADNPKLEVTAPVAVTLGGYSGKYVDLQVPSDISRCPTSYFVWEPGIYAQGPSQRWHLWILDVNGVRVVVQSTDYAGTSAQDRADMQAIVDSIQIEP